MLSRKRLLQTFCAGATCALLSSILTPSLQAAASDPWKAIVDPQNSFTVLLTKNGTIIGRVGLRSWAPEWVYKTVSSTTKGSGTTLDVTGTFTVDAAANQVITVRQVVTRPTTKQLQFTYTVSAPVDVPITLLTGRIGFESAYQGGTATLTYSDNTTKQLALSWGKGSSSPATVKSVSFAPTGEGTFTLTKSPVSAYSWDNELRAAFAQTVFPAGTQTYTLTYDFPSGVSTAFTQSDIDALSQRVDDDAWFTITGTNTTAASVIGMENWLDKPAGAKGPVLMQDDKFVFKNTGEAVKFWGVNLSYKDGNAPTKTQAEYTAKRYAKFGINAVRMHKFTNSGFEGIGDPNDATKFLAADFDRFDYFTDQLADNGIYYGWSHTYQMKVRPDNKSQVLAYDELVNNYGGNTYGVINWAEDLQDLLIQRTVNLLNHTNPYSGVKYANDPALAYVELQNEDNIMWYYTAEVAKRLPTYAAKLKERFNDWLIQKYGTDTALKTAWGSALVSGESLVGKTVGTATNPYDFSTPGLAGKTGGARQRLLDNAAFFYDVQNKFYTRFVKAIRDTGYVGPITGSPWKGATLLPHAYNLKSDYLVGFIDRHSYFGGSVERTLMNDIGSGYFSYGLHQVVDRPFSLSEWVTNYASTFNSEGAAIIGAYGLGLQGWDASFAFDSRHTSRAFGSDAGTLNSPWRVDTPPQIGQYPSIARMIYRRDVSQGATISTRVITPDNLATGTFDFSEEVVKLNNNNDTTTHISSIDNKSLAAGRVVVKFADSGSTTPPNLSLYDDGTTVTSTSSQLKWNYADGYATVSTSGTKALFGFSPGKNVQLGSFGFNLKSPYASVFLTAIEKDKLLSTPGRTALLTVVGQTANRGLTYFTLDKRVIDEGTGLVTEPVIVDVSTSTYKAKTVNILDQDGLRTGKTVPVTDGKFTVNTGVDKTLYYEVIFQ